MLTHFERVMVAAQVYAGGALSPRRAVEIAAELEALTAARDMSSAKRVSEHRDPEMGAPPVQPSPATLDELTTYYHRERLARMPFFALADVDDGSGEATT